MKKVVRIFLNIISTVSFVVVLGCCVLFGLPRLYGAIPGMVGTEPITVVSGSMRPTIGIGSVVYLDPQFDDIKTGDIITYQTRSGDADSLVTHRVVGISSGDDKMYTLLGDDNSAEDDPVKSEQIRGVIRTPAYALTGGLWDYKGFWAIPKLGYVQVKLPLVLASCVAAILLSEIVKGTTIERVKPRRALI